MSVAISENVFRFEKNELEYPIFSPLFPCVYIIFFVCLLVDVILYCWFARCIFLSSIYISVQQSHFHSEIAIGFFFQPKKSDTLQSTIYSLIVFAVAIQLKYWILHFEMYFFVFHKVFFSRYISIHFNIHFSQWKLALIRFFLLQCFLFSCFVGISIFVFSEWLPMFFA